jgi:hypothetical protein
VVGDDDAVDAAPRRLAGVVGVLDALDDQRQRGRLAKPGEVVPAQRRVRLDAEEVAGRRALVLLRGLLQSRPEDRVLEVVGDAHAVEERQPGLLQVARLPAGDEGVDGEHDRAVARRLGAADEARRELAVVRPVELEPARRPAAGRGDLLQGEVRVGAGDQRHADGRRGARRRQLAVLVDDLLHADRGEQQRRRHRRAEQLQREVARGDVAQHPRHDPAPLEGGPVGVHRVLGAGAGEDVVRRPLVHRLVRAPLLLLDRDRDRGRLPTQPAGVDLAVIVGEIDHRRASLS